ncbi:DNA replication and repair protein RecF [Membranihabitans marinus]
MGKTNILDAIYFMAFGKSYYSISDKKLIHFDHVKDDSAFFRIESIDEVDCHYVFSFNALRKKVVSKDKQVYDKISEHIGNIPLVSIFPEDIDIIKGDSSIRRRFIDNTICQSDREYLRALLYYNKVLKRKRELLKQFSMRYEDKILLLKKYDFELSQPAAIIIQKRSEFLTTFNSLLTDFYHRICNADLETVLAKYKVSIEEEGYLEAVENQRKNEIQRGRALVGPHKDDIDFQLMGQSAKYYSSQGQQKSILFALKLAQYEYIRSVIDRKPLLLLDDIFDKLDQNRIDNLMDLLRGESFGQIFITDTDAMRIQEAAEKADFKFLNFNIREGKQV